MTDHLCKKCKKTLISDEIALHRKYYGISSKSYLCLDCQAEYMNVTRKHLEYVIYRYHVRGNCTLFAKWDEEQIKRYGEEYAAK